MCAFIINGVLLNQRELEQVAKQSFPTKTISSVRVPRAMQVTMALAVVIWLLFIWPYVGVILFSAVIAFVFSPVYRFILRKTKRDGLAMTGTLLTALLALVIPATLIIALTVNQVSSLVDKFQEGNINLGTAQVEGIVDEGTGRVNQVLAALPGGAEVDKEKIIEQVQNALVGMLDALVGILTGLGVGFFGFITTTIIAIFLIMAMLRYQNELVTFLKSLSPFDDSINNHYLARARAMTKAMIRGQFIIAIAQGFAGALSLWIVGVDYFWFFVVFLSFLSFIPLGGGIITIPIGIIMIVTGNIWQGIFVILWHVLVVSTIDNILRPQLVPKNARLNTALMLLAVFAGIAFFGAPGVIYGPVIMILLQTTFEMYSQYNRTHPRIGLPNKAKS